MDKLHKQIVKGFSSNDVSPAAMSYKMLRESKYVNQSILQYLVNYVILMATSPVIPLHLQEVQSDCQALYTSLQELGLTGTVGRESEKTTEYLQV